MAQTDTTPGEVLENARADVGWKPEELIAQIKKRLGSDRAFSPQTLRNIETGRTRRPDIHSIHAIVFVLNFQGARTVPEWKTLKVSELYPAGGR